MCLNGIRQEPCGLRLTVEGSERKVPSFLAVAGQFRRFRNACRGSRLRPMVAVGVVAVVVAAVVGSAGWSQPTRPSLPSGIDLDKPLTLADCVQIALTTNPTLVIAGNSVRQASAAVTQTRSAELPSLTFEGSASAAKLRGSSGSAGGALPSRSTSTTSWGTDLVLAQTLYQSGLFEEVRSAKAAERASRFGLDDTRRTVVLNVTQSYYAALAARTLVDVAGRALGSSTQHVDAARARIAQGTAAQADVYPFEVEVAQARLGVITAENQMQTSLTSLKEAIGLPAETSLQLAEELGRPPLAEKLPDLLQAAYRERPDILQQQAVVRSAQLTLRVAEIQRGPVLDVAGNASYGAGEGSSGAAAQIQAGVSFPLFDGWLTKARADSARFTVSSASQMLRQLEIAVSAEVERSYLNAAEANNRIDASEAAALAAQVSLDAAEGRYLEGIGTVIDVTDAELKLRQAEVDRVQAYYDYNTALAALRAAIGQLAAPGVK